MCTHFLMYAGMYTHMKRCCWHAHLKAFGNDGGLVASAPRKVMMQLVDEPGPELQRICLLLYGEALLAAAHHSLHELVRAHLHRAATTFSHSQDSTMCLGLIVYPKPLHPKPLYLKRLLPCYSNLLGCLQLWWEGYIAAHCSLPELVRAHLHRAATAYSHSQDSTMCKIACILQQLA